MTPPQIALADARDAFEYYLMATTAFRRSVPLPEGNYTYPEETIQVDAAAFAGIFVSVWRALEDRATLESYSRAIPGAFDELRRIVTPNPGDVRGFTKHAGLWERGTRVCPTGLDGLGTLCRTLRNGLAHFNFRYINVAPSEYFPRLGLSPPSYIEDPDEPCWYRIFICDWKPGCAFQNLDSNPRIV